VKTLSITVPDNLAERIHDYETDNNSIYNTYNDYCSGIVNNTRVTITTKTL
jgi:hypothetical protein